MDYTREFVCMVEYFYEEIEKASKELEDDDRKIEKNDLMVILKKLNINIEDQDLRKI